MGNIKLHDFKEFVATWSKRVKDQYGADLTQETPQLVVNPVTLNGGNKPKTLVGGSLIKVVSGSDREDKDPKKTFVKVQVVGPERMPDGKSKTGHGVGNPYAGDIHTVPRNTYLYMTQPGASPQATAQPPQ